MEIEKLITIVITALITFALTKLWDWWRESEKTKYEERKLLSKSLYNLTNFWQTLQSWDFEKQTDLANRLLFEQFSRMGAKPENLEKIQLNEIDKNKLISIQTQNANDKLKLLGEQFESAVEKLSEISPLIASELHEIQLRTPIEPIEKYVQAQLKDGKERSEFDLNMIASIENQYFQAYKTRLSERLKPYILLIAKEIDGKTLKETTEYLEKLERDWKNSFDESNFEEMLTTSEFFVDMLVKAHQTASQENLSAKITKEKNTEKEIKENGKKRD